MLPLSRVTTALVPADSGSVFRMGSAISRIGRIWAAVSAMPLREAKAPDTMPKAALKARYSEGLTPLFTARAYMTSVPVRETARVMTPLIFKNRGGS